MSGFLSTASIKINKILPPSSAGIGRRFITPRLALKSAINAPRFKSTILKPSGFDSSTVSPIAFTIATNPKASAIKNRLEVLAEKLHAGTPINEISGVDPDDIADLHLLTAKPVIYVFNVNEETLASEDKKQSLRNLVPHARSLFICAKLEDEIKGLNPSDTLELLQSYDVPEAGLTQMIRAAYDLLGLQSYLTAGPKEVRAWTIHQGWTAPQAAGVIHTDFEKGFIAAQVVNYDDLVAAGSEANARAAGKIRTEGKTYVMQPDDVVEFRFNVSK